MSDVGYGIRLKGDANGFVAENTKAGKSLAGVADAADKTKNAVEAAAEAVSDLAAEAGKAATATGQMAKAGTEAAAAGEKSAAATRKTAEATGAAATGAREASVAVEALGKSHAVAAVEQQKASSGLKDFARGQAEIARQANASRNAIAGLGKSTAEAFRQDFSQWLDQRAASALTASQEAIGKSQVVMDQAVKSAERLSGGFSAASGAGATLGKALTQQAAGADTAAGSTEKLSKSTALVVAQSEKGTNAIKLQAHQVTNLGYQLQDMAVQLAGGQSPFLVMMQQVPQAAGAVGGFSTLFRLAFSPAVLGVAAPLALVAGSIFLIGQRAASISSQTRELTQTLKAMGNVADVSAAQLRKISIDAANAGPFTRDETYDATKGLLSHRRIAGDMINQVMALSVDFSAGTSQDLAKGTEMLASALEKGYAGIKQLDEQFGLLTEDELRQIRTMAEHGRQAEAMQMAIDALNRRFQGAAREGMSEAAKALADVGAAWNDLLDRLANSKIVYNAATDIAAAFKWLGQQARGDDPDISQQVAAKSRQLIEAQQRLDLAQSAASPYGGPSRRVEEAKAEVERLRKEIDDLVARGRAQVADLEASAVKAQAEAGRAAIEQSAKAVSDLSDQMERQRQILAVPAPARDLVRARQQAEDFTRDKQLVGDDAERAQSLFVGAASAQIAAGARDAATAAKLQADAQEALARAAGQSAEAVRRAGVENKVAAFAYQYAGAGVKEYAAQLWRGYEAEEAMRRAEWTRQIDAQVAANDNLTRAYRAGTTAALDSAERENEIREVMERTGAAYDQAAQGVDRLRASRKALDAERALSSLRRDVEDAEALTGALRNADPAASRRAQIEAATRRFANDNRLSDNDNKVTEYRSLKEREYADQVKRSAVETNRAQDATFRYREAMASLNEQRASGVLTEQAFTEQWKQLERDKLEASKDFADGAKRALWDYAEEAGNAAKRAERLFSNAFSAMEDALVSFVKTGKLDFASLADSIISDLIRMQIQAQITAPLSGMMSSFFGGLFGGGSGSSAGTVGDFPTGGATAVAHTGGVIGQDSLVRRYADHAIFNNAARYHVGGIVGLKPGEVPIIANRNEEVLTEDNPRHIFNASRPSAVGGKNAAAEVNLDVQVIDQRSSDSPPVQVSRERGPDGSTLLRVLIPAIRKDLAQRGDFAQSIEGTYDVGRKRGAR